MAVVASPNGNQVSWGTAVEVSPDNISHSMVTYHKDGKFIICPECNQGAFVFHCSWSALSCQHCNAMVEKYQWKVTG